MSHQLNLIDLALLPVPARPPVAVLAGFALIGLVGVAGHLVWERGQYARTLAAPGAAEVVAEAEPPAEDPAHEARLRQVQRDEALRDALAGSADLPVDSAQRLREVAQALPDALWLKQIEIDGSRALRISGGALDTAALAVYVARLGQVPALRGLPLHGLSLEPRRDETAAPEGETAPPPLSYHHFALASGEASAEAGGTP